MRIASNVSLDGTKTDDIADGLKVSTIETEDILQGATLNDFMKSLIRCRLLDKASTASIESIV